MSPSHAPTSPQTPAAKHIHMKVYSNGEASNPTQLKDLAASVPKLGNSALAEPKDFYSDEDGTRTQW